MIEKVTNAFRTNFQAEPILTFSPGRINLIGEHVDYQEGFVFPAAIQQGIWVAIQRNQKSLFRLYSVDFDEEFAFSPQEFSPKKGHWANYAMGMVSQLNQAGFYPEGFDLAFGGNIPGSGLSSSAAISIATGIAISSLFGYAIPKKSLVLYAQKSEHLFAGVNCGIMDPYASAFGVQDHALLLDCRNNQHQEVRADFGDYSLVLVNSKVSHSLADSAYNKRREACEKSVRILKPTFPEIKTLRDISTSDLEVIKEILPQDLFPKAKHQITEIQRVFDAVDALKRNDLIRFGLLLNESHASLSQDYEVSCAELDFLAEEAQKLPEVLGARMMGGGFGGVTLNLVKTDSLEIFKTKIAEPYLHNFGINPDFIPVSPGDGGRLIS
jgi:galactokinase